jgi:hypothetical protein
MAKDLLTALLLEVSNSWGLPEEDILEYINKMGYHESKSDPTAIQQLNDGGHGRGRGILQYEIDSTTGFPNYENIQGGARTAINRLIEYNKNLGDKYDISFINQLLPRKYDVSGNAYLENIHSGPEPQNLYDFSQLSKEEQIIMFLADKFRDKTANMGKYDTEGDFDKKGNPIGDGKLSNKELARFHADEHWAGHKGDKNKRDAFIKKVSEDYQFYKP